MAEHEASATLAAWLAKQPARSLIVTRRTRGKGDVAPLHLQPRAEEEEKLASYIWAGLSKISNATCDSGLLWFYLAGIMVLVISAPQRLCVL